MKTICISLLILLASLASLAQDKLITDNHHKTLARLVTCNNQTIALSNRLIAHYQQAQTWEGVDADHPDAVALRDKIAQEETQYSNKASECGAVFDPITKWIRTGTHDEMREFIMRETTSTMDECKTQRERYHALGY